MNWYVACKERLVPVAFSKAKLSFLLFISWNRMRIHCGQRISVFGRLRLFC